MFNCRVAAPRQILATTTGSVACREETEAAFVRADIENRSRTRQIQRFLNEHLFFG